MTHNQQIGSTIRHLRKKARLTQQQLAEMAETTRGKIARVEDAVTSPNLNTLDAIAKALNCTFNIEIKER